MLNQEVRNIMKSNPVVVGPEDNLADVRKMMLEKRIQQIPVVDAENQFQGLITTFDMWKDASNNEDLASKKVKEVMNTRVIKITPKDKLGTAAELFMDRRFKSLPVVNLRNELKGVITAFDVIKESLKEEYPRPILYADAFKES